MKNPKHLYTYGDTLTLFAQMTDDFMEETGVPTQQQINDWNWLINADIDVRDFMMVIVKEFGMESSISYVEYLLSHTPQEDSVPLKVILAMFNFENGSKEKAVEILNSAMEINPRYPLLIVITNNLELNWTPEQFEKLRNYLYKTTTEVIKSKLDIVVL